ncbi:MAG: hypothetical protein JOZ31_01490 [Verrucomicrobia bacterium]|nr:hypothetical protein [Verrucomicrobiota bacterium]MBV8485901.1 hypothetical protein [Verrucomicrobiota bacterium]
MSHQFFVDDNFQYTDEEHRYLLGEFETLEEAVAACKKVVDRCLEDDHKPGMRADELMKLYCLFGDDPFIMESGVHFSARDYAGKRVTKGSK